MSLKPRKGMPVKWVDPDSTANPKFVKHSLMHEHGEKDLRIRTVRDRGEQFIGRNRYVITLSRRGRPIRDKWNAKAYGPKPKSYRPKIVSVSYAWLEPATPAL